MMPDTVGPSAATIPVTPESWTPALLYIHLSGKIEDLKSSLGDLRTGDRLALDAALDAAEKATDKYERDVERWREANNEWRATLTEREVKFLLIATFDNRMIGIDAAVLELRASRDQAIGLRATVEAQAKEISELQEFKNKALGRMAAQTGIGTALAVAVSIALRFLA